MEEVKVNMEELCMDFTRMNIIHVNVTLKHFGATSGAT